MPSTAALLLFSASALVLLLVPGPAVLYIVARSASDGRRAGLVSVLGIHTGTLVHVAGALVGLSALIVASAVAFSAVKLAGAVYLVVLGVQALRSARHTSRDLAAELPGHRSLRRIYTDGVVVNILNPKTAVFFLAFVPQFVDADAVHPTSQLLVLSAVFIVLGLVSDGAYALLGSWLGARLGRSPGFARRRDRVAGVSYISLGVLTGVSGGVLADA
jgi:threonine/homoserine/homoserine lactone efflux protein